MHGQSLKTSARLSRLGLRPKKRLSQSFLEDDRVAAAIVRAAKLGQQTDVLEVGPGLGALTRRLTKQARSVVAVELDTQLAEQLQAPNLTVVNQDILQFDPSQWFNDPYTVVANLPYHISSPALRHLLASGPPFAERLVVMLQVEVAERITSKPGDMSALAVSIQAQAQPKIIKRVPAAAFYPRPKVDSAVVLLEPLADRLIARDEIEPFTELVQAGFKQPRKTIANSLADGLDTTRTTAVQRLEAAGIDPSLRPQALGLEDWVRLFRTV